MSTNIAAPRVLDTAELHARIIDMYTQVADAPAGEFHFEMGRALAERLGYTAAELDAVPSAAVDSFAGVGYFFDRAALRPGETVVDLGSGSGMDAFIAGVHVGPGGRVIGIDMTEAQLAKAGRLRAAHDALHVEFRRGTLERPPVDDGSADCVISNGVINLCADKEQVFREAARMLRPGGRLALADIVTERQLPPAISCNATLWAACIGGAAQQDSYRAQIAAAGLRVLEVRHNVQYAFLSGSARGASDRYGVKSISLLAVKETE